MKEKAEEAKARLKTITVKGEAGNGAVTVIASGDREIKDIVIGDELADADREELQDLLVLAVNKALENAKNVEEAELKNSMGGLLPNLPGMGF